MPGADLSRPWVPPTAGPFELAAGALAGVAGRAAAPLARAAVAGGLQRVFRGDDAGSSASPPDLADPSRDPGWFGPASVTWRVHADTSMFVGGIVALALQALHPRAMAGVADHSDFRHDPLGRLRRTAAFVGTTAYGTSEEAAGAVAAVRAVHRRVRGTTPDGRPYAADDPELIDWVHVSEFAAFAAAQRRFGGEPMDDAELDRYVAEVARIAEALGDPAPPRSWAELDDALQHRHRPQLAIGEQARDAWRFLERAGTVLPPAVRPAYRQLFVGAVACLPPWARRLWGVPRVPVGEVAACRALVRGMGALLGEPPGLAAARARVTPAAAAS